MAISVLVVDQDEVTRDIIVRFIERRLPRVIIHVTNEYEAALGFCTTYPVDIVLTTTSWPPDATERMLKQLRDIPHDPLKILIMTSETDPEVWRAAEKLPNSSLVAVPLNLDDLINKLNDRIAQIGRERQES